MRSKRLRRLIRWLTVFSIVVGFVSTLTYSSGAHLALRYLDPPLGAWWNAHEFDFMEASACVLGLLIAVRCASRLVEHRETNVKLMFLIIGAILVVPLSRMVASIARLGWGADSASIREFLQAITDYGAGNVLDKIVIGGVYFLKSIAVAALAGLALYAAVTVIVMIFERPDPISDHREAPLHE